MAYTTKDLYSTRHAATIQTLKGKDFADSDDWKTVIDEARLLVVPEGYDVEKYRACEGLRKRVAAGEKKNVKPAATMLTGAGVTSLPSVGSKSIPPAVAKRVAALETLRHLWLLKKSGSHKLWVLSLPESYRDWPEADLAGKDYDGISARLNDQSTHFSAEDRKHLSQATQNGLKWVHRALLVAASPDKKKHQAILKRWFADANTKAVDIQNAAAVLTAGLKKIAACIKSNFVLVTDMPLDRGNAATANVNAFVFSSEGIDVIYVEPAFFSNRDMFKDLKNWTRIIVHELSHRMVKTADHRYRHHSAGLKPDAGDAKFTAAKALDNADSWAMFCMDCAGQMVDGDYTKVKVDA
ncbi:MAG: M35 family metallo-endopeptidase [Rubrivivax sp.]|nr:M35 family metallo-endopeptidase [Rubrivivax sp.]